MADGTVIVDGVAVEPLKAASLMVIPAETDVIGMVLWEKVYALANEAARQDRKPDWTTLRIEGASPVPWRAEGCVEIRASVEAVANVK